MIRAAGALVVPAGKILGIKMLRVIAFVLALFVSSAHASSWDFTYFNPDQGALFIDSDSIAETPEGTVKFWALCAPRFERGKPVEAYAYRQSLYEVHCKQRLLAMPLTVRFDVDGASSEQVFEEAQMEDIQPDTQEDFLWTYICKPQQRPEMAVAMRQGIQIFLLEQRRYVRELLAFQHGKGR